MCAARSVHLWWETPKPITEVSAQVSVDESVSGSYFCACGFDGGYMGIQELLSPGNDTPIPKRVIFSLWDSDLGKVNVVESGPNVVTERFGGEGVGFHSLMPFNWELGEVCTCMVQASISGPMTTYKAYFRASSGDWKHLATYEVPVKGRLLQGLYSFVEDFKRNGTSQKETRRARYAIETRYLNNPPKRSLEATFTGDNNTLTNINAYVDGPWLGLATGGNVVQKTPLGTKIHINL